MRPAPTRSGGVFSSTSTWHSVSASGLPPWRGRWGSVGRPSATAFGVNTYRVRGRSRRYETSVLGCDSGDGGRGASLQTRYNRLHKQTTSYLGRTRHLEPIRAHPSVPTRCHSVPQIGRGPTRHSSAIERQKVSPMPTRCRSMPGATSWYLVPIRAHPSDDQLQGTGARLPPARATEGITTTNSLPLATGKGQLEATRAHPSPSLPADQLPVSGAVHGRNKKEKQ